MYGNSGSTPTPTVIGALGGGLAMTGADPSFGAIVVGFCLVVGGLLLVRARRFRKTEG